MSLWGRLARTRDGIAGLVGVKRAIDDSFFDDLEDAFLLADFGINATESVMNAIRVRHRRKKFTDSTELVEFTRELLVEQLVSDDDEGVILDSSPFIILMVGVNGVGKTTTCARLAYYYKEYGKKVIMGACDTFRAAAVEQLVQWGERIDVPVIHQASGSDAAAVAHDTIQAAKARKMDVALLDTAGRQHTHGQLMDQLEKTRRVVRKIDETAPHETWLVVDATTGQNALSQYEHFNERTPITGVCVTKLDGTAKGGVVIALREKYGVPIRFIGVGEGMGDLEPFDPYAFAHALVPEFEMES